jgi:hypothetical protein
MKFYPILLLVCLLSCNNEPSAPKTHTPNGTVISVTGFSRLVSNIGADIQIVVNADSPASCILQCEKSIEDQIIFNESNDELHISSKPNFTFNNNKPVNIIIRVKELKSISCNGSGKIVVEGPVISGQFEVENDGSTQMIIKEIDTKQLSIQCNGSGEMIVQGKCVSFKGSILGSGSIKALDLQAENTEAELTGSGNLETRVSKTLDVNITGSGSVLYAGSPAVTKNITGSGTVSSQ